MCLETYRLIFNYRDTNNKGDRQPIGLCAPKKNVCGADTPLYVYSGTHKSKRKTKFLNNRLLSVQNNVEKISYFYTTQDNYSFTPDKKDYKLANGGKPLCYIYSRSDERKKQISQKYFNFACLML